MAVRVYLKAGWLEWLKTYLKFNKFKKTTFNMAEWGRRTYGITTKDNKKAVKELAALLLEKQKQGLFRKVDIPHGMNIKSKDTYVLFPDNYIVTLPHCVSIQEPVKKIKKKYKNKVKCDNTFYETWEWKTLRYKVLKKYGARCMLCGRGLEDGVKICVDHIKPRALFPELELEESNLQVLCNDCNMGKGRWDDTDWRKKPQSDIKIRKAGKE